MSTTAISALIEPEIPYEADKYTRLRDTPSHLAGNRTVPVSSLPSP